MAEDVAAALITSAASALAQKGFKKVYHVAKDRYQKRKSKKMPNYRSTTRGSKPRRDLNTALRNLAGEAQRAQMRGSNTRTGGLIDIEKKFFDLNSSKILSLGTFVDIPPFNSLTCPAQGDGATQRDGRVFYIHSLHIRGYLVVPNYVSATIPEESIARLVLVWDTQANNSPVTPNEVYSDVTTGDPANQFRNLEHSSRFIVFKDKAIRLRPVAFTWNGTQYAVPEQRIPFKMNKTFKNPIKVRTSGTTTAVSSITDNNITIIGGFSGSAPATCTAYVSSRCRFTG